MKIIGLTGGIASGKSTVSRVLKDLGAIIIDSDDVAHDIIAPRKPAWHDIVKLFGPRVLNPDMTVNRDILGEIVFNDTTQLKNLNQIVHPRVAERFKDDLQELRNMQPDAVVVMDVPLLFETHMERICDVVWVVWVDRETQKQRLMKRNNYSEEEATIRIDAQMSLDEKADMADVVIDNSRNIEETIVTATRNFKDIIKDS
ncbi:MAG TPA: dephospho-CoA kinase [Syntrophomonadaceae bacterium]|nr:dephospho-CoA kinase [Syntrophomonadaceae bacterium]